MSALGGMVTTTELHWPEEIPITPDDDQWHDHSQHWWETETTWWSFNVPERKMGGWLYTQVLTVQGTCNGGAWVWDDSDAGALYEVRHQGLPFPDRGDLRDATLPERQHRRDARAADEVPHHLLRPRSVRGRSRARGDHAAALAPRRCVAVLGDPPLRPADARDRHDRALRRGDPGRLLLGARPLVGAAPGRAHAAGEEAAARRAARP